MNDVDLLKFKQIKIIYPHAKDIIPFVLLSIKNNNFLSVVNINPNYLNNIL